MTKVIFIAILSLVTALRTAGVPVMPAALEPRRVPSGGALFPPPLVALNQLDEVEYPVGSAPVSVAELRPATEAPSFPAAHQAQQVAVLNSTSIEVARRPQAQGRGKRERRFGLRQKFFRGARRHGWIANSPKLDLRASRRRVSPGGTPTSAPEGSHAGDPSGGFQTPRRKEN